MEFYKVDQNTNPIGTSHDVENLMATAATYSGDLKFTEAIDIYRNLLDTDTTTTQRFEIFKNLGNALLKTGDIAGAEENYHKAYRIFPANLSLTINYGVLEIQKGDLSAAKKRFIEALSKDDSNDLAWVGLSLVHRGHADFDLSRACMLRALDINFANKTALTQYYLWCREDGVEASMEYVKAYLASNPGDDEILSILSKYNG